MADRTRTPRPIELSTLEAIPECDWDLPDDEAYIRLGCRDTCGNAVCFLASNYTSETPEFARNPQDTSDLNDLIDEVPYRRTFRGFETNITRGPECSEGCSYKEEIPVLLEMINERFNADLSVEG